MSRKWFSLNNKAKSPLLYGIQHCLAKWVENQENNKGLLNTKFFSMKTQLQKVFAILQSIPRRYYLFALVLVIITATPLIYDRLRQLGDAGATEEGEFPTPTILKERTYHPSAGTNSQGTPNPTTIIHEIVEVEEEISTRKRTKEEQEHLSEEPLSTIVPMLYRDPAEEDDVILIVPTVHPSVNSLPPEIFSYSSLSPEEIIVVVGSENIYGADLIEQLSYYPSKDHSTDLVEHAIDVLVRESVIIQGSIDEGIIQAPSTEQKAFNVWQKDYQIRARLVSNAKEAIKTKIERIEGVLFMIWFNNIYPGEYGYEKGKARAKEVIEQVHGALKNGEINLDEAAEAIYAEEDLVFVDPVYENNAANYFIADGDDRCITAWCNDYDEYLWTLEQGDVSEIWLLKDDHLGSRPLLGSVYTFSAITVTNPDAAYDSFEDWLNEKRKLYPIAVAKERMQPR